MVRESCPIFIQRLPCGCEALPPPRAAAGPAIQRSSRRDRTPARGPRAPGSLGRHRVRVHEQDLLRLPRQRPLPGALPLHPRGEAPARGRGAEAGEA